MLDPAGGRADAWAASLPQHHNHADNQDGQHDNDRYDAANERWGAFRAHHGMVANKSLKVPLICWISTVAGANVLVAQFKAFGTTTATVTVRQVALGTLFDLLDPYLATVDAAPATWTNRTRRSNDGVTAGTSNPGQLVHASGRPT